LGEGFLESREGTVSEINTQMVLKKMGLEDGSL